MFIEKSICNIDKYNKHLNIYKKGSPFQRWVMKLQCNRTLHSYIWPRAFFRLGCLCAGVNFFVDWSPKLIRGRVGSSGGERGRAEFRSIRLRCFWKSACRVERITTWFWKEIWTNFSHAKAIKSATFLLWLQTSHANKNIIPGSRFQL